MVRHVDIFIPATPPAQERKPAGTQRLASAKPVRRVGNDIIQPSGKPPLNHLRPWYPQHKPQPVVVAEPRQEPPAPPLRPFRAPATPAAVPKPKRARRGRRIALMAAAGCVILAAGMLLQAAVYGELLIAAYAVVALIRHVKSRTTFMLALFSLGCILAMLLFRPDPVLMQNFAIYAFLLLLVGTVSLTTETRY